MQYLASQAAQESAKLTLSSSDRNALSDGTGGGMGRELKEAERRQGLLMDIMKKEVRLKQFCYGWVFVDKIPRTKF